MQTLGSEALDKLFSLGIDTELDIVEEEQQKKEFKIDNDDLAEWALTKIKAERQDMERLVAICEKKIEEYEEKIRLFKQQYENSSSFLKSHLNQYFQTVPHKKTKPHGYGFWQDKKSKSLYWYKVSVWKGEISPIFS